MNRDRLRVWRFYGDEVSDVTEYPPRTRYRSELRTAVSRGPQDSDLVIYRKDDESGEVILGRFSLADHQYAIPGQPLPAELQERLENATTE